MKNVMRRCRRSASGNPSTQKNSYAQRTSLCAKREVADADAWRKDGKGRAGTRNVTNDYSALTTPKVEAANVSVDKGR
ncbi:hypothetical protein K432DRAFT_380042 [Lepidopterella palustris CBS 459.81]|uniref:Uncharacterized protein n=1 Tax=Lepidopterella palustris CBS 459.81 TaxID=1314670 RepID=A0A8E2JI59_9PEZI|nr:hypothetical protein K432DRAFT_380042 [Lepidopterella palustris CBS 459.81]